MKRNRRFKTVILAALVAGALASLPRVRDEWGRPRTPTPLPGSIGSPVTRADTPAGRAAAGQRPTEGRRLAGSADRQAADRQTLPGAAPVDPVTVRAVPRNATPSHNAAPGQAAPGHAANAGMVAAIDPETGQLGMPNEAQMRRISESEQARLSHSSVGLVEVHHPDGSVSVDTQGRFQEFETVRIGRDGKKTFRCVSDTTARFDAAASGSAQGAAPAPKPQPAPAPKPAEER